MEDQIDGGSEERSEGIRSMEDWLAAQAAGYSAPSLDELLPELSREEQQRIHDRRRERERSIRRHSKKPPPPPIRRFEQEHDASIMPHVIHALRHYNARHPGGEFDAVKPIREASVGFRGSLWHHFNFWARSRSSNKIKRFFAELHYKTSGSIVPLILPLPPTVAMTVLIPIVETCTIIEEPLCQYNKKKSWCAFCSSISDILHPIGNRKFICGNSKEHSYQKLSRCNHQRQGPIE